MDSKNEHIVMVHDSMQNKSMPAAYVHRFDDCYDSYDGNDGSCVRPSFFNAFSVVEAFCPLSGNYLSYL